ncbi:hypothetical protein INT45_003200 [Circinella minor]|uniref:Cytochrome c oxidase subunit n=1 Tax=Circinella minor TaxID=1195481 RepID=A0A8H7VB58_9FUNG|nr:hypothetical protein INT45_003200 [Circinella minor]
MSESADVKLTTAGFDARCWQNYVDYFKCINARGEDFAPCKQFYRAYHSLCPNEWIEKWDTQREEGTNPSNFEV